MRTKVSLAFTVALLNLTTAVAGFLSEKFTYGWISEIHCCAELNPIFAVDSADFSESW